MGSRGDTEEPHGVRLAREMAAAFNARDGERFAAVAHPDIAFVPLLTPTEEPYRGREGMRRYLEDAFAWASATLTLEPPVCVGELMAARARIALEPPGGPVDLDVMYVARIRDGLIAELITLPNSATVPTPLGRPPAVVDELRLELPAVATSVALARRAVRAYATTNRVEDLDAIELATSEAVTNAVLHAYLDQPVGTIVVRSHCDEPGWLQVCVEDRGRGLLPRPDSPGLGLGISMMNRLAAEVRFTGPPQRPAGTEVRLSFRRGAPG